MGRESGPSTKDKQLMTVELALQNQLPDATKFIDLLFQKDGVAEALKLVKGSGEKRALTKTLNDLKWQCELDPALVNDGQQKILTRVLARCLFSQGGIGLQNKNDISTLSNYFSNKRDLLTENTTDYERILEAALYKVFAGVDAFLTKYKGEEREQDRLAKRQNSSPNMLTKYTPHLIGIGVVALLTTQLPNLLKFGGSQPINNPPTEVEKDPVSAITNAKTLGQLQDALDKHAKSAGIEVRNGSDTDSERGVVLRSDNNNFDIDNFTVNGSRVDLAKTIWNILEKDIDNPASWNRRRERVGDGYLIYIGKKDGTW